MRVVALGRKAAGGVLAFLITLSAPVGLSAQPAQEDQIGDGETDGVGEAHDSATAPEMAPEMVAPFVVRRYDRRPKKVWKGLLQALSQAGYPPEVVDEESLSVTTSFVDFESKNFARSPADPPLPLGSRNYIITLKEVRAGKVSLRIEIGKVPGGSELRVRARILVEGLDRRQRVRVLTDRRSSGAVEEDLLMKIEAILGLKPL